jgi:beta-phosphoglucomutase-like phosphatase (HAD superfamily)
VLVACSLPCHLSAHATQLTASEHFEQANLQRHFNVIVECKEEKLNRLDPSLYTLAAKRIAAQVPKLVRECE